MKREPCSPPGTTERSFGLMAMMILLAASLMSCWGCNERTEVEKPLKPKEVVIVNKKPWLTLLEAKTGKKEYEAYAAHLDHLKKRYGGKIDATVTGPAADEHRQRFERLMREWNPLDATLAQIHAIAGKPTSESKHHIHYIFDNGKSVVRWEFGNMFRRTGPFSGPDRLEKLRAADSKNGKTR